MAITGHLAGIMIWEVGQDALDKERSLLSVIEQQVRSSQQRQDQSDSGK